MLQYYRARASEGENALTDMSLLITIDAFDPFKEVRDIAEETLSPELLNAVRKLDEADEMEVFLRAILSDFNQTPHGPAEIVDIFTHRVSVQNQCGMAAFILKGKSFPTVRAADVSHQIYRLKKIAGLKYAVFAAAGTVLDAAKEQFVATCEEEGVYYSIFGASELARLFVAYGYICPKDGNLVSAGRCRCGYSPRKRMLNLLQREALQGLVQARTRNERTGLVVLPPGSGKTRIAAEDALARDAKSVLFLAHTHEILDVAASEFIAKFGSNAVAQPGNGNEFRKQRRVTLATVQLVAEQLAAIEPDRFDYVVIDEFHHAAASSYRRILERLKPDFLLGLTATPYRGDRQNVLQLCNHVIVVGYELRFGIECGVLSPYHYYGCFDDIDYSRIQHNGVSYDIHDLERALVIAKRDKAIIRQWREKAEGKPTLAFCCTIRHAERVARHFSEAGIPAAVYASTTSPDERKRLQMQFKHGAIQVLCAVDVFNEGADLPFVECLLFLRPTESKRIFLQQLGRGLRRSPGKERCAVIDFIGNFKNAHRVIEYQDLLPFPNSPDIDYAAISRHPKDLLNLPLGCEVTFEDKVIELFASRTSSFEFATRFNIERILLYQYDRLAQRMGRAPTKRELDRTCLVGSEIYATLWGSWDEFMEQVRNRPIL